MKLELFYSKAKSAMQAERARYLKGKKALPIAQELPEVKEISAEEYAKLRFLARIAYKMELNRQKRAYKRAKKGQKRPVDDVLTRGYNAGLEMAITLLRREYKRFTKRDDLDEEE